MTAAPSYESYIDEKDNRDLSQIPGTFGYPLFGHTFSFLNDPLATTVGEYRKYEPVFRQSLAFSPILII